MIKTLSTKTINVTHLIQPDIPLNCKQLASNKLAQLVVQQKPGVNQNSFVAYFTHLYNAPCN